MSIESSEDTRDSVFGQEEWVPPGSNARATAVYAALSLAFVGVCLAAFAALVDSSQVGLVVAGLLSSMLLLAFAHMIIARHHVVHDRLETIFHVTTARWEQDSLITLAATRGSWLRGFLFQRESAVYFFRLRPTRKHVQQQDLGGRKATPRFLYELAPITPIAVYYQRSAASLVYHDVTARVVNRQALPVDRP